VSPERINVPGFAPFSMELITLWTREQPDAAECGAARFRVLDPNGNELNVTNYDLDLTENLRRRIISKLGGLPVRGTGIYKFVIELERR
jgi:hypothetical protein